MAGRSLSVPPLPVLLVHGIYDSHRRMGRMAGALRGCGFAPVYAMDIVPADGSISIENMGAQVLDAARNLLNAAQTSKLDIVAYSMGALAARYCLQRLGGQAITRRFVSISGPHHGTLSAYVGWQAGVRQMRPDSGLLRDLNADLASLRGVEVYSFWTPLDLTIFPAKSACLEGARNRAFIVMVHFLMPSDRQVIAAVIEALS